MSDKYHYVARRAWSRANGRPVPRGHQVHHIDRDITNNSPENLVLMSALEHQRLHRATEPHRPVICGRCGKEFGNPWPYKPAIYCSNACRAAARRASGVDDIERRCERCGTSFWVNRYKKQRFCSLQCSEPGRYVRARDVFHCVHCDRSFEARDRRAMYCSEACRKRYYRTHRGC
jgi:HNH endonuclease